MQCCFAWRNCGDSRVLLHTHVGLCLPQKVQNHWGAAASPQGCPNWSTRRTRKALQHARSRQPHQVVVWAKTKATGLRPNRRASKQLCTHRPAQLEIRCGRGQQNNRGTVHMYTQLPHMKPTPLSTWHTRHCELLLQLYPACQKYLPHTIQRGHFLRLGESYFI